MRMGMIVFAVVMIMLMGVIVVVLVVLVFFRMFHLPLRFGNM
jgi:hypothetical protein